MSRVIGIAVVSAAVLSAISVKSLPGLETATTRYPFSSIWRMSSWWKILNVAGIVLVTTQIGRLSFMRVLPGTVVGARSLPRGR